LSSIDFSFMLKSIHFKDFKSYRQATLPLAPLTVLVGANASGKSNALEGVRFLSWLAQGHKLSSLQYQVNQSEQVVRGRVPDLPRQGTTEFTLGCDREAKAFDRLRLTISLREDEELHIGHEEIEYLYKTEYPSQGAGTDMVISYNNFARGGRNPQVRFSDQAAVFAQWGSVAPSLPVKKEAARQALIDSAADFEYLLANILLLDPSPVNMRQYSFLAEKKLMGDGSNLSSVLHHLWHDPQQAEANREDLLAFISSLPEQDIRSMGFLEGPRGEVMLQLTETFGGAATNYDASLLSDGTLRVLAIAAAILSAPKGSMVIIEEIGNGVHPSRAQHLLAQIDHVARRRHLNLLISTHNPALLDALPTQALGDVVFCYRDAIEGDSRLCRLQDVPDYPELMAQGTLGDLVTQGLLDRFVKHHPGSEAKKQQAMDWLTSLR